MKSVNENFTDQEFEALKEAKGFMTWRDFILTLTIKDKDRKTEIKEEDLY